MGSKEKKGDCDDMSRVLVDLLRSYGIPAVIAYGYVIIESKWLKHYVIPVENTTYIFHYAGPHAFTIAYVPGLGWMPVDLLAGSMIVYPFVFENFSASTEVNKTAVEEFKNMSKKLVAIQLIAALSKDEYKGILSCSSNPIEAISLYVNKTMGLINAATATTTVTTTNTQASNVTKTTLSKSENTSTTRVTPITTINTVVTTRPSTLITKHTTARSIATRTAITTSVLVPNIPTVNITSTSSHPSFTTLRTVPQLVSIKSTTSYTISTHTATPITTSLLTSISHKTKATPIATTSTSTHTHSSCTRTESSPTLTQLKPPATILIPAIAIIIVIALATVILRKAL